MTRVSGLGVRSGVAQIVIGVLVTALLSGAILWSAWESWHNALNDARRTSAQVAATIAAQAGETLQRGAAIADDLRRQVTRDPALLVAGGPRLGALLASIGSAAPAGMGVTLADGDGKVIATSLPTDPRAGDLSIDRQPSFLIHRDAAAGAGTGVVISPPFALNAGERVAFVIGTAIRDERGRLLGVAAVSVPAGRAFRNLDIASGGTGSHAALVHRDGYTLDIVPDPADTPLPLRPVSAWAQDPDGPGGTIDGASPFSYRRAIVSHQTVARFPVDAIVARDVDDVFARWRGDRSGRLVVYGVMIVAAIGLNLWLFLAVRGRLRAEAALRESSEGRFSEFASIASDWFWETDTEHRFTFVSEGVSSLGVPPDSFLGKKRTERAQALPGPVSPRLIELERLMELRRPIRGHVFDAVMHNGERRWYEVSARPHVDDDGVFRGYRGVARDVTTLRDAQDRVAASEARLIDSINSMPIGYALWSARDRLVAWNRRYVEIWPTAGDLLQPGITFAAYMEKAMRRAWTEISEEELKDRIAERISRHANCGEPWTREFPDGRVIEFSEVRTTDGGIVSLYSDVTERQGMLKRIAESEARFRDGIESMGQGFMLWGADNRLVAWNRRAVMMLDHAAPSFVEGIDRDTFMMEAARRAFPHFDEAQMEAWAARRIAARRNNEPFELETPTGRILVASSQIMSDGGIVVTYNDITELREVEKALRESAARFRDGIESMADGFSLWDAEGRLVAWNSRFEKIAPLEAEVLRPGITYAQCIEHLERRLAEIDPPWDWRAYIARRRHRRDVLGKSIEVTNIRGTMLEIIEQPTSEGGVVSIYRDVTDARRAAMRLADSEARFHDFADAASDWYWETDADHRFTHVSAGLRKLGKDPDALIGLTREEHARAHGREPAPELVELRAILDRREVIRGFCFASSPNTVGVRHSVEIHGKPIFDAAGVFLGYRGVGRDVTLRNQQQAELARALIAEREMNAQQRRFVSIASHEFRTPLAVIDGATQRLIARLGDADDETHRRLERIRGAVSRMTELIERTLSSARLDEGRIEIETQFFDLGGLLRDVIDRQRQISPSFEIIADSPERELVVEGDAKLLEQVFSNLLSNAVKYSGRARRIEVVVGARADAVDVAVHDHGLGIHADEVPQLFTRFFRARSSMGIPGTGIGLHLVRELVRMHGGDVMVQSEIGVGTTFTVALPRRQSAVPAVDAAQ